MDFGQLNNDYERLKRALFNDYSTTVELILCSFVHWCFTALSYSSHKKSALKGRFGYEFTKSSNSFNQNLKVVCTTAPNLLAPSTVAFP